jgi:alpha-N-arabinofuranosidase
VVEKATTAIVVAAAKASLPTDDHEVQQPFPGSRLGSVPGMLDLVMAPRFPRRRRRVCWSAELLTYQERDGGKCTERPMMRCTAILFLASFFLLGVHAEVRSGAGAGTTHLKNAGFEAGTDNWEVVVYGAKSEAVADPAIVREGRQSLRISASNPSDTALGQEIQLKPGRLYRFSGWVRTRGLDPHGAPVSSTYQIQQPGGRGIIASGRSHKGDTDWTEVAIHFESPPSGKVRVAVFFVGFGRGTGTAWFDDLRLEEIDAAKASIKVTREPLVQAAIDPKQYGQFVEYLCDLVPSMWAEKLYDGSFEGLSPYKFYYLKETDFRERPWYPTGATNRADFALDSAKPVSGRVAKRITIRPGAPATAGIAQDGIAIAPDQPCEFSCFLRQEGVPGPVTVRLHNAAEEYATCEFMPTAEWRKHRARLSFTKGDTSATLSISFRGPGTVWLDNASLMPEKTVGGWRQDVVEAVRALKPGIIRFGGSALDDANLGEFDWRDTLGDPDKRKPFRAWGGLQPTGPGLEEIVQFCQAVGAEPLICVRVSGKGPKDAADQVEYFNGSQQTDLGRLRAKNGHPEPYRIKYWQIGNERAGKDYEARLPVFCEAMKRVDPTIELLSSYPTAGVLDKAAAWLDFVCPHHYAIEDLAGMENDLNAVRDLIRRHAAKRDIRVGVTEWNTTAGDIGPNRAKLWTLNNALACARYHNQLHRHADLVTIANRSNLCNSFCSGIIQTDNHRLYKTPTYYTQQLYATLAGSRPLRIDSSVPANTAPDISATLSAAGDVLTVFAVNRSLNDVTRRLDLSTFGDEGREATVWILTDTRHAGEPDVTNSFAEPDRIVPVQSKRKTSAAPFEVRFPALSLSVMQWRLK